MDIEKALENLKTIKLRGGVFGKTSLVLLILSICVTAVSIKVDVWWIPLALMLPLMGIVLYILKRCLDFAEKNPHAAIMDGAELLVHERIIHGMKGHDFLPDLPPTIDHETPALSREEINAPDPIPLPYPVADAGTEKEAQ